MTAIQDVMQKALLEHIQNNEMTTTELRQVMETDAGAFLADLTLAEIFSGAPIATSGGRARRSLGAGEVNTRTKEARYIYDKDVYNFIVNQGKDEDGKTARRISASEIRANVGGNGDQCRKSLNRLIEAGLLAYEGQAQATRYFLTPYGLKKGADAFAEKMPIPNGGGKEAEAA